MMQTSEMQAGIPALYPALGAVQSALAKVGVGKHGVNEQQRFRYRAWDDVQQVLAPILAENNMLIIPRVMAREESEMHTKSGTTMYRVVLRGEIVFLSCVDGSCYSYPAIGEAMDTGDKATSKALTMLVKYGVLHALCIPLEGQPDADATTPDETVKATSAPQIMVTATQAEELTALIDGSDLSEEQFLAWIKTDAVMHVPADDYGRCVRALKKRQTTQAQEVA